VIVLEAPGITVTMLEEHGGKITSIVDAASGREWLESPAQPLGGLADSTVPYDAGDMCGWDEMVPTIERCDYPGTASSLPDHGELWSKSWEVSARTPTSATTEVAGDALPYRFERTLSVSPSALHVEYSLTTESDDDLQLLWAAHPLFAAWPGTRLVLDPGEFESDVFDTSVAEDLAEGSSRKLFAKVRTASCTARLLDEAGPTLALRWRRAEAPYVGLWLDHCEYSRHPVIAIEPTNGFADSLSEAGASLAWTVSARQPRRWSLDVVLRS
jgi:galactose mutarotase-like enzyme